MTWSLALPNLLVGLREGLEAGLVVTILIGAVRRLAPGRSLTGVWLGVAAAAVLSLSFGAVLTFTRAELSPHAQESFAGAASVISVILVTSMIFWMRRAARGMAGELRERVGDALSAGGTALVVTAFVAVAREGLEAALFVWTNAQAAGSSTSPLLGAVIGLAIASALCLGLYRRVVTLNLARFFTITGGVLVVIVAGVLAYGIGDLQDANLLPGLNSVAFDVSAQVPTGTWWAETIRGVTNINNRMSWLQVIAYLGYLLIVLSLFLRKPAPAQPALAEAVAEGTDQSPNTEKVTGPSRARVLIAAAVLAIPVLGAGTWIAVDRTRNAQASGGPTVTVTDSSCAADWNAPSVGHSTYAVRNNSAHAVDVEIVETASGAVAAEIEVLGPGTSRDLPAALTAIAYSWKCVYSGAPTTQSVSRTPTGTAAAGAAVVSIKPNSTAAMTPVLTRYRSYVAGQLALLQRQVGALRTAVDAGDRRSAQACWVTAHATYHRIGAAYNAFGDAGSAVDGLASGLPDGTEDAGFVGFHRIELQLWSGRPVTDVRRQAARLETAVAALHARLPSFTFEPNDVTIRAHEIIEDTLRFTLTGQDDYGSHTALGTARADLEGDRVLVDLLAPLLNERNRALVPAIHRDMATLADVLSRMATSAGLSSTALTAVPQPARMKLNAATSQLTETLAPIPDLLEIRAQ
ncbi:FTR1 family protein [Jatrophihabitans telluris]|uniref:FTR1 family protein n=1 Tax=Jatrophihabitans telluris TaxID=2038343 RepID=A0ABY4QUU2_9ACTN|nr:iron uptake transporter permease EfeU [Jatrophihabitans telluris]UQX87394.1 FTR1 family protein [Jatrophihabitans telluris]